MSNFQKIAIKVATRTVADSRFVFPKAYKTLSNGNKKRLVKNKLAQFRVYFLTLTFKIKYKQKHPAKFLHKFKRYF